MKKYLTNRAKTTTLKEIVVSSFVITPNDDEEFTAQGILLSEDAVLNIKLWNDKNPVQMFLRGGVVHPLGVKAVYATDSDDVTIIGFN